MDVNRLKTLCTEGFTIVVPLWHIGGIQIIFRGSTYIWGGGYIQMGSTVGVIFIEPYRPSGKYSILPSGYVIVK